MNKHTHLSKEIYGKEHSLLTNDEKEIIRKEGERMLYKVSTLDEIYIPDNNYLDKLANGESSNKNTQL